MTLEQIGESRLFKRVYNPATKAGGLLATVVGAGFLLFSQGGERDCANNPLRHVYAPKRLEVLKTCVQVDGTVVKATKERDGDYHIQAAVDPEWLSPKNLTRQHGNLVVEYMPGDPFPRPKVGQRLRWMGTFVNDKQHGGWHEIHPVFYVTPLDPVVVP